MSITCSFSGNSDFYGLGVRIGVYLQWLTSMGAAYFCLEGSGDYSETYLVFEVAIIIALYILTFSNHEAYVVEAVIMLYMLYGGFFAVTAVRGIRKPERRPPPQMWRFIVINSAVLCLTAYALWFWTVGRNGVYFQSSVCRNPPVFLFARIRPADFDKVAIFFTTVSALCVFLPFIMTMLYWTFIKLRTTELLECLGVATQRNLYLDKNEIIAEVNSKGFYHPVVELTTSGWRCGRGTQAIHLHDFTVSDITVDTGVGNERRKIYIETLIRLQDLPVRFKGVIIDSAFLDAFSFLYSDMGVTTIPARIRVSIKRWSLYLDFFKRQKEMRLELMRPVLLKILPAFAFVYSITAIELTLRWNKIDGVYDVRSTGQLIPLIIGLTGMVKLFVDVRREYKVGIT